MRFSIITPSHGQPDWLKLCVASVADQGVEHEHIIQHAGPLDDAFAWLHADRRVKVFAEADSGMYDALNRGFRRAGGEIIAWLNCDEEYLPGALSAVEDYFKANPRTEILFAHAVVVDAGGNYLYHRKSVAPRLWHTWTCPLGTLSCAMFFRRSVTPERKLFLDPAMRYCGDAEWLARCLRQGIRMGVLNHFTSVYAKTGGNLSFSAAAEEESRRFFATAPGWMRAIAPLMVAHHRLRKWLGGAYSQRPFSFSIYTRESPDARVVRQAVNPSGRWRF